MTFGVSGLDCTKGRLLCLNLDIMYFHVHYIMFSMYIELMNGEKIYFDDVNT